MNRIVTFEDSKIRWGSFVESPCLWVTSVKPWTANLKRWLPDHRYVREFSISYCNSVRVLSCLIFNRETKANLLRKKNKWSRFSYIYLVNFMSLDAVAHPLSFSPPASSLRTTRRGPNLWRSSDLHVENMPAQAPSGDPSAKSLRVMCTRIALITSNCSKETSSRARKTRCV